MRTRHGPRPREVSHLVLDLFRARGRPSAPAAGGVPADPGEQGRALFFLGAGCSASAGIPLAAKVAKEAIKDLASKYGLEPAPPDEKQALARLIDEGRIPERFRPKDDEVLWGSLYSYVFSDHYKHLNEQRDLLSKLIDVDGYKLNWAHACLGALVEERYIHTILTTNFDQLALQGVIRTGIVPVVADALESLSRISPTPKRPQIVHLHGSMHTYELRNSFAALRETEHDRGLQVMMMSILKEASVLVVVGYAGGEEGIMALLQRAADSSPKMVVYWIAYENDYAMLSKQAKRFLNSGENKDFILGQRADDFFNSLAGELGVGAPKWIKNPLGVLETQSIILYGKNSSEDVARLAASYKERVTFASNNGRRKDTLEDRVTELRSALKFKDAAEIIEREEASYASQPTLLRLHARSLFAHYKKHSSSADPYLHRAISEFFEIRRSDPSGPPEDTALLIEALLSRFDSLAGDSPDGATTLQEIKEAATLCQASIDRAADPNNWSLMDFYKAEALQLEAERLYRDGDEEQKIATRSKRQPLHDGAARAYREALTPLTRSDPVKARECKEGLAGALSCLAECDGKSLLTDAQLREARALFQEVVDLAKINTPDHEYAGALENLATVIHTIGDHFPDERELAHQQEAEHLRVALAVYEDLEDEDGVERVQRRLS